MTEPEPTVEAGTLSVELTGRTAVVTGASRGIGRAIAEGLLASGARVIGLQRGADDGPTGEGYRALAVDLADRAAVRAIAERLVGEERIDILVNNGGFNRRHRFEEFPAEDWDAVLEVHLRSVMTLCQVIGSSMLDRGGVIINIASMTSFFGGVDIAAYSAAKGAVAQLTKSLSNEWAGRGVRVNAIAPMARTRMTLDVPALDEIMKPVERGFDRVAPEHVSPLVVYLASAQCRFTGRIFGIEGDDLFLFEGWSAEHHLNNDGQPWSVAGLERGLADLDAQDRGWMIAPSVRLAGPSPADETLAALDRVARLGGV